MKTFWHWALSLIVVAGAAVGGLAAEHPRDAGSKARGDIYHFWVGQSSHAHAQNQARNLYNYGQTGEAIAAPKAQEHVADVKKNVQTSQKALGELKKGNPDNKEAHEAIAKIEAIHQKVLADCESIDKQLNDGKTDNATIMSCCADIHSDLDAANMELNKLMKALKIEKPALSTKEVKPTEAKK